jgi:hypothetical protein
MKNINLFPIRTREDLENLLHSFISNKVNEFNDYIDTKDISEEIMLDFFLPWIQIEEIYEEENEEINECYIKSSLIKDIYEQVFKNNDEIYLILEKVREYNWIDENGIRLFLKILVSVSENLLLVFSKDMEIFYDRKKKKFDIYHTALNF